MIKPPAKMIKPPTIRYPLAASCPKMVVSQFEPPKKSTNWLVDLSPALLKFMAKPMFNPNINQHFIFLVGDLLCCRILYIFLVEGFCGWYGGTPNEPHHEMCDVNIADFHAEPLRSASHNKSQEMQNKKEIHQGLLGAPTD